MQMSPELKERLQLVMVVAILVSGCRLAYILYQRHESQIEEAKKQAPPLNPDYYVTPRKLYPYDPARHRVDFSQEAGKLLPIEKLRIKDVITADAPQSPGERQVMAVFEKDGKSYAFSVGSIKGIDY